MIKILIGIVVGILIPFVAGFFFVELGGMPVATAGAPLPFEKWIARVSINRAMGAEINRPCPIPADEINLIKGSRVYVAQCAVCHGVPDLPPTAIASGLFPSAPQLLDLKGNGVTDDSAGETYWKARNGIRLTGMPGFSKGLSNTELWQVSLLLQHAHDLPRSVRDSLKAPK